MGLKELNKQIDNLSNCYCEVLLKARTPEDRIKTFEAFYRSILLIQQLQIEQICQKIPSSKKCCISLVKQEG
ncbi:hypothetical protein [Persephonella sp.]